MLIKTIFCLIVGALYSILQRASGWGSRWEAGWSPREGVVYVGGLSPDWLDYLRVDNCHISDYRLVPYFTDI